MKWFSHSRMALAVVLFLLAGCSYKHQSAAPEVALVAQPPAEKVFGVFGVITGDSFEALRGSLTPSGEVCRRHAYDFDFVSAGVRAVEESLRDVYEEVEFHETEQDTAYMLRWGVEGEVVAFLTGFQPQLDCREEAGGVTCRATTDLALASYVSGHIGRRFERAVQSSSSAEVGAGRTGEECTVGSQALADSFSLALTDSLAQLTGAMLAAPRLRDNQWRGQSTDSCGNAWALGLGMFGGKLTGWLRWNDVEYVVRGDLQADGSVPPIRAFKSDQHRNSLGPKILLIENLAFGGDSAQASFGIEKAGLLTCPGGITLERL